MIDITQHQTRFNNPNNWLDNMQPKQGCFSQYEHTLNYKRQTSSINEEGVKMYGEFVKQRKIFIYNTVKVEDDDVFKYDYNVLQEV
jgi:hypothetical protein